MTKGRIGEKWRKNEAEEQLTEIHPGNGFLSISQEISARKSVSEVTYLVLNGILNLKSVNFGNDFDDCVCVCVCVCVCLSSFCVLCFYSTFLYGSMWSDANKWMNETMNEWKWPLKCLYYLLLCHFLSPVNPFTMNVILFNTNASSHSVVPKLTHPCHVFLLHHCIPLENLSRYSRMLWVTAIAGTCNTEWAKKMDCFWVLITLRQLMGERHVMYQIFFNFVYEKYKNCM